MICTLPSCRLGHYGVVHNTPWSLLLRPCDSFHISPLPCDKHTAAPPCCCMHLLIYAIMSVCTYLCQCASWQVVVSVLQTNEPEGRTSLDA